MRVIELGITRFQEAYDFQMESVRKVSQGAIDDTLLITEHHPVITIGRRGSAENILKTGEYLSSLE